MTKQPHLDKPNMEFLLHQRFSIHSVFFHDGASKQSAEESAFNDSRKLFILRPALLTDGKKERCDWQEQSFRMLGVFLARMSELVS